MACRGRLSGVLVAVVVLTAVPVAAWAEASAERAELPVLCLETSPPTLASGGDGGLLLRELMRQAILLAARDELGLATRDMTLREPFPETVEAAGRVLAVDTKVITNKYATLTIRNPGQDEPVWTKRMRLKQGGSDYVTILIYAERLARTALPDKLTEWGYPRVAREGSAVSAESVTPLLADMSFLAQCAALRKLHGATGSDGPSPEATGMLVRAYAHLGVLTQPFWNSTSKVFIARSLLYAQRLVAASPDSALALWHRAYAYALAGLHKEALADLDAGGASPDQPAPPWVALIHAYCRYDMTRFHAFCADVEATTSAPASQPASTPVATLAPEDRPLAQMLRLMALQHSWGSAAIMKAWYGLTTASPACYWAHEVTTAQGGVSNLRRMAQHVPNSLNMAVRYSFHGMDNVPQEAKTALLRFDKLAEGGDIGPLAAVVEVAKRLVSASAQPSDLTEPSWGMVARMMQEHVFLRCLHEMDLVRDMLCLPADTVERYADQCVPYLDGHPYQAWVDAYRFNKHRQRDAIRKRLADMEIVDAQQTLYPMIRELYYIEEKDGPAHRAWRALLWHDDAIVFDFMKRFIASSQENRPEVGRTLRKISPHSPDAKAILLTWDWDAVKDNAVRWASEHEDHPAVLRALAKQYARLDLPDDAKPLLEKYIEISPDAWAYQQLADAHKGSGDREQWKAVLTRCLEESLDLGLTHTNIRIAIADWLMREDRDAEALPYAEQAGQSWSGNGLMCASRCNERLGNWGDAEMWVRRCAERYEGSQTDWFLWCHRTGRGDVAGARKMAMTYIDRVGATAGSAQLNRIGVIHMLDGKPAEARTWFDRCLNEAGNPYCGLQAALLAWHGDDIEARDATLAKIRASRDTAEHGDQAWAQRLMDLARVFERHLDSPDSPKLDLDRVEILLAEAVGHERVNINYFTGRVLVFLGQRDLGLTYLKRAAESRHTQKFCHVLARRWLTGNGVELATVPPYPWE